jgi:hypothetical protein
VVPRTFVDFPHNQYKNEELVVVIFFWKPRSKGRLQRQLSAKHEVQWYVDSHFTSILSNLTRIVDIDFSWGGAFQML